jgi:hypothetical protein
MEFQTLVHLFIVGYTIEIYYDAHQYKHQTSTPRYIYIFLISSISTTEHCPCHQASGPSEKKKKNHIPRNRTVHYRVHNTATCQINPLFLVL